MFTAAVQRCHLLLHHVWSMRLLVLASGMWHATILTHCRYEMGRQAANTKLSSNVSVRRVRVRGGNFKFRALRLDSGNFSWGSEAVTRKTRVLDVVYNSSNNELVGVAPCCWPLLAGGG